MRPSIYPLQFFNSLYKRNEIINIKKNSQRGYLFAKFSRPHVHLTKEYSICNACSDFFVDMSMDVKIFFTSICVFHVHFHVLHVQIDVHFYKLLSFFGREYGREAKILCPKRKKWTWVWTWKNFHVHTQKNYILFFLYSVQYSLIAAIWSLNFSSSIFRLTCTLHASILLPSIPLFLISFFTSFNLVSILVM